MTLTSRWNVVALVLAAIVIYAVAARGGGGSGY